MKKVFCSLIVLMFSQNSFAIDINDNDVPVGQKCLISNPVKSALAFNASNWSPTKWGLGDNQDFIAMSQWSPTIAGARVGADGNIAVRFVMQQSDINFFKATFAEIDASMGNTRIPLALELDIIDHNGAFGTATVDDFTIVEENISGDGVDIEEDVSAYDDINTISAIMYHPENLKADKLYQVVFHANNRLKDTGTIHMNWQVTVNYKWMAAMKNSISQKCDLLDYMSLFASHGIDNSTKITGDFGSNIPTKALNPWYYYAASVNDSSHEVAFQVGQENDAVCWNDYDLPAHNDSNKKYCKELWRIGIGGNASHECIQVGCFDESGSGGDNGGSGGSSGGDTGGSSGTTLEDTVEAPTPINGPNANVSKVQASLQSNSNYENTLYVFPGDEIKIKAWVDNKGDVDFNNPIIHYFIDSGNQDLDGQSDDKVGEDNIAKLTPGLELSEKIQHIVVPSTAGNHWVFACIRSDNTGQTDVDWSNNCPNRRQEYVKLIVQEIPQIPPAGGSSSPSLDCAGADKAKCAAIINIIFD